MSCWIKMLAAVPVAMMLSQCALPITITRKHDPCDWVYVEGIVVDGTTREPIWHARIEVLAWWDERSWDPHENAYEIGVLRTDEQGHFAGGFRRKSCFTYYWVEANAGCWYFSSSTLLKGERADRDLLIALYRDPNPPCGAAPRGEDNEAID